MKKCKIKMKDGSVKEMSYEELCHSMGIEAQIHFVDITAKGTITFTAGRIDEIALLRRAADDCGYRVSHKVLDILRKP